MSPIFVRPVREQLEHDRLIRFLQTKYKKKFDVLANTGDEQLAALKIGQTTFFPDLLLTTGKRLAGVVEVESGESVNNLEAMAQWVHFARARAPFHLYVPVTSFDAARRLSDANQVKVAELWTYRVTSDGFDLVRGLYDPVAATVPPAPAPAKKASGAAAKPKKSAKHAKPAKPAKPAKSAKPAKAKPKKPARSGKTAARKTAKKAGKR